MWRQFIDACLQNNTVKVRTLVKDRAVSDKINKLFDYTAEADKGPGYEPNAKTIFHVASNRSVLPIFNILLNAGAKPNINTSRGDLPLHFASSSQLDAEAKIKTLIGHDKQSVNATNNMGETPLFYAIQWNRFTVAKLLTDNSASTRVLTSDESSLLHYACRSSVDAQEKVQYLINDHPDYINSRNKNGQTALSHCCKYQAKIEIIQMLLAHGADVSIADNEGYLPIHNACSNTAAGAEVVDAILNIDSSYRDVAVENKTPLYLAANNNNLNVVKVLLARGAPTETSTDRQPLHTACMLASPEIVKLLLENGADVNIKGSEGFSPLHILSLDDTGTLMEKLEILLRAGADVNAVSDEGYTPLHWFVKMNRYPAALRLLDQGADAYIKDISGKTAGNYLPSIMLSPELTGNAGDPVAERAFEAHVQLFTRLI